MKLKKAGIYSITCSNGIVYVGQSRDIKTRWRAHRSNLRNGNHGNPILQRCFNKHGEDSFVFEVLLECGLDVLTENEIITVNLLRDQGRRLANTDSCRDSLVRGQKRSESTIEKMRKAKKGTVHSEATREKLRISNVGQRRSDAAREKMSLAKKGKAPPREVTEKARIANTGRIVSLATRAKLSLALKGKVRTIPEETRRKVLEATKRRLPVSMETRKRISQSNTGRPVSEQTRKKISEANRRRWAKRTPTTLELPFVWEA